MADRRTEIGMLSWILDQWSSLFAWIRSLYRRLFDQEEMESNETILERFLISEERGFLIDCSKVKLHDCWGKYQEIVDNLNESVRNKEVRRQIQNQLDERDLIYPEDRLELLKLHQSLAFLTAGYMWQGGDQNVPNMLPRCLAIPLHQVSTALGVKPILGYPSIILANWKLKNESEEIGLGNLEAICNLPGENSTAAEWFVIVHIVIEYRFAPAIKAILDAMRSANDDPSEENDRQLIKNLKVIPDVMKSMVDTFKKMKENLTPEYFYDRLRIFLNGWGSGKPPLPEGLLYEGVDGVRKMMKGGSAEQCTIFQFLDAALDITHKETENSLSQARDYMLAEHREFVAYVRKHSNIKCYVLESSTEVKKAFNNCIDAVAKFRREHFAQVHYYVKKPSQREDRNRDVEIIIATGTGSTSYSEFLTKVCKETLASKVHVED